MIRAVIFDWSGTLADDQALTRAVTNDVLIHFGGEPVDEETYRRDFRLPVEHFYRGRIGPVSRAQVDEVFFARFRDRSTESQLFEGVLPYLWLLKKRGMQLAVLSSMSSDILEGLVAYFQLGGLFQEVLGNAGDKRVALPGLIKKLAVPSDQVLYLGDMENDVQAAKQAGAIAGAALYGYANPDRLRDQGPDHQFSSLDEVITLLDRDYLLATEQRVIATVGGVVCNDAGELLLVRTRKWRNKYGIPGGKIEYGETMQQAYFREIKEETGFTVDNATWVVTQDCIESEEFTEQRHFLLINYFSRLSGKPAPIANYESNQIGWYSYEEALQMDLNQPTRTLLEMESMEQLIRGQRQ